MRSRAAVSWVVATLVALGAGCAASGRRVAAEDGSDAGSAWRDRRGTDDRSATGTETGTGDGTGNGTATRTGTATGTGDGTGTDDGTDPVAANPPPGAVDRGGYVEIDVPGFLPAVVFVPPGPGDARFPLAVVMHGAGGRPEPHCEHWRRLLRERAYLLCPRGTPWGHVPEGGEPAGYFFREHKTLGRELVAALASARATLAPRLDAERALFIGFSQGATMGALFLHELARDPATAGTFGRVALVEGGTGQWNVALSRIVKERGVDKVLMVCGQRSCSRDAEKSEAWMRKGGIDVRFEDAPGAGHTWGGGVGERVVAALPWLLEGDPRF